MTNIKPAYLKRIQIEVPELLEKYSDVTIYYNKIQITIIIKNIKFILDSCFPFAPPKVRVNNISYIQFLRAPTQRINKLINYFKQDCPCCKTIVCVRNWTPSTRILTIMEEIEKFVQLKEKIKYKIAVDDICKYKNVDFSSVGMSILGFLY